MFEQLLDKWQTNKLLVGLLALVALLSLALGILVFRPAEPDASDWSSPTFLVKEEVEEVGLDQPQTATILVDVKGAVSQTGVYELAPESRVRDALALAGGLLPDANQKAINLAQKLTDEAVVYVPFEDEEVEQVTGLLAPSDGTHSGKVNINTADQAQLQTISGIGAKRAQDIIAYREANGRFQTIDDLTKVSGIGAKTLDRMREEVSLD